MANDRKSFWTTVPGIVSGIAAIVTGLAVLIPLALGFGGKHTNKNTASQSPSPGVTSSTGTGTSDTASPLPSDSSSPFGAGGPSDSSSIPALGISANPSSVSLGGKAPDATVTITNPGSTDVTIEKAEITGANAAAFSITSTTCGEKSTLSPKESCQVVLHYTPPALGSASAALQVHYNPPQSSYTTVQLKGSGGLLG
jgi:hypothetical protein